MNVNWLGSYQNILKMNSVILNHTRNGSVEGERILGAHLGLFSRGMGRIRAFLGNMNWCMALQHS